MLRKKYADYDLTKRFSPGYGDFPLTAQKDFQNILELRKTTGIGLTESLTLTPSKSVTAVIGLRPKTDDVFYMNEAIKLAEIAAGMGEAPVGAVVVRSGEIVGSGYNRRETDKNALAHAEIAAIADACASIGSWRLLDCTIYVTLEPCPMCAGAIINSRIGRVVFGAYDGKAGSCGSVVNLFGLDYNHKPECEGGVLKERCGEILSGFFKGLRGAGKAF
jgi:tRNA(adenine34) deaminase